ncbi:MAG: hypothetical protein KUG61_00865 [Parvibaculaceae bacterium]|nr:hypothetical protein [Parvibaculaceae bacterium]
MMDYQCDGARSRGFWMRCLMVAGMVPFMAACVNAPYKYEQTAVVPSKPLKKLTAMVPDEKIEDGWEAKFEEFVERHGLGADRYDWQEPVRGSFRTEDRNGRSIRITDYVGWYGCGWAYYAAPPEGIHTHAVRIAATFYKGKLVQALNLHESAEEACRYAPPLFPTNVPTGPITSSPRGSSNTKRTETRTMSDGSRTKSVEIGGKLQHLQSTLPPK